MLIYALDDAVGGGDYVIFIEERATAEVETVKCLQRYLE